MKMCACGNAAEAGSALCARCTALQTLELKTGASNDEVRNAFEVLSKAWSPDRFQGDEKMKAIAEEKLKAIDAAQSFLLRSSVQAAPFRSQAEGSRVETPIDAAPVDEIPRPGRKSRKLGSSDGEESHFRLPLPLVIACGALLSAVVVFWFLFNPLDSMLMRVPVAGKVYADSKAAIRSEFQELKNKAGLGVGPAAPSTSTAGPASTSAPSEPAQEPGITAPSAQRIAPNQRSESRVVPPRAAHSQPAEGRALPLITAGLTRTEVIAAQGAPTAESAGEMDYGNSKLYFDSGVLTGWRIDPSSPLRVKLWPDAAVDPNLQSFGMGSTRNEVIVVEGTPTTYSQTMFGYGKSEVYFQYGRVVGWKNDAATPLRTTSR